MNLKIRATALLICFCMVITLLTGCGLEELIPDFMLPDESDSYAEIQDTVTVSVLDGEHYRITSANPVRVGIGANATFTVEIDEGYEYSSNSIDAEYADGKITVADVQRHVSLEIATKKQNIVITHTHSGGTAICTTGAVCDECGKEYTDPLGHSISATASFDANGHWYECERNGCDYTEGAAQHTGGTATCTALAACEVCGYGYGIFANHEWQSELSHDEVCHWYACKNPDCTAQNGFTSHYGGEATYTEQAVCEGCGTPYGNLADKPPHEHSGGTATCTSAAICEGCGLPYGSSLGHDWADVPVGDIFVHWYECEREGCDATGNSESHSGGTATYYDYAICDLCGSQYGELVPKPEFETVILEADEPADGYRFLCWTANKSAEEGGVVFGETASGTFQMPFEATPVANYVDVNHHVILYRANGGTTQDGNDYYYQTFSNKDYQMPNTINQNGTFVRDGYVLMRYTENADGSGEYTTLGGKIVPNDNGFIELYCKWGKVTENGISYSVYTRDDGGLAACVQSYTGSDEQVVIPAYFEVDYEGSRLNLPVDKIAAGAFKNAPMKSLVISHTVMTIEDGAFEGCSELVELTIHDNFTNVKDAAFKGAPISTIYLNAARLPTHGDSFFCLKYEKLRMTYVQGKNTIVVMSGSSSLYGFYAQQMQEAFYGEYEVVNYGTNAGSNSLFYMNAFVRFMDEGDIMLNAPEIGGNDAQMAITSLTRWTIRALERMYEVVSYVDMTEFDGFFDAVSDHNANRGSDQSYEYANRTLVNEYTDLANNVDNWTYSGTAKYNPCNKGKLTQERADRLNLLNERLRANGVLLYMSFAPVNVQECVDSALDPANQAAFRAHCEAMLDYPVISDPGTYIMEQKYFSNAGYHLGKTGAQIRTSNLTADLKAQMIIDGLWYEE